MKLASSSERTDADIAKAAKAALDYAWDVPGTVKFSVEDGWITPIESALVRAAEIDANNIHVDVSDGRVILEGKVHSWYEKQEAKREAWMAPGVREVVDDLQIS